MSGEESGVTSVTESSESAVWRTGKSRGLAEPTLVLLIPGHEEEVALVFGRAGDSKLLW